MEKRSAPDVLTFMDGIDGHQLNLLLLDYISRQRSLAFLLVDHQMIFIRSAPRLGTILDV